MPKKIVYEFVKKSFEKEGYELLSEEYVNAHSKLRYKCPKGHKHSIVWSDWQQGNRCPYCAGQGKPTIEFIRSEFDKESYKLLTKEYINCKQKLEYICSNGHKHSIIWTSWRRGHRCPYCVGNGKPIIEFIRSEFVKEGYNLLTKKYVNNEQKLDYVCPKGHKYSIAWGNWCSGRRCPYCAGQGKPTIEFVKSEFEREDYILLTKKYINSYQKLEYICSNGHKHNISWHNWQAGHRCPECVGIISKGEIEVKNFIEFLGTKVSSNDRNQIFNPFTNYPLELDIFIPDLNKAIEYNGEYWHKNKDVKNRDLLKQQLCKSKDIDLLTIWDKEWSNNSREYKEKIMKFMF